MTIIFWITSMVGLLYVQSKGLVIDFSLAIFHSFSNDFLAASFLGLVIFIPYLLLNHFKSGWGLVFTKVIFGIAILVEVALIKYFSETFLLLGSDLLGYSLGDTIATIKSLEDLSFWYVVPIFALLAFFIGLYSLLRKFITKKYAIDSVLMGLVVCCSFKLVFAHAASDTYRNKIEFLATDIHRSTFNTEAQNSSNKFSEQEYPLLREAPHHDVLGPLLDIGNEKPNIVFIVAEGLGRDFTGTHAQYGGFTPFLDSLSKKSLSWDNFLCTSGRSFGAMPSIFASLPYGSEGFMEMQNPPLHLSIFSILKANGYEVSYFEGSQSSFDRKINFLESQGVTNVVDMGNFGPDYHKIEENAAGFSWGYPDGEIFRKVLSSLGETRQPRLDVIFTVSGHEPFLFPGSDRYEKSVDSLILNSNLSESRKSVIEANKPVFASLLYTDEALRKFMTGYEKRSDFHKTIFIITGDHRLIPIPHKDALCRFHVPFLIYSPMIKRPQTFSSISSHLDVAPSLIAFLKYNHQLNAPKHVSWLGTGIDTTRNFHSDREIPFMKFKGSISDFLYKDYFYSQDQLFRISEKLNLSPIRDDSLTNNMAKSLADFKVLNKFLTDHDRIYPDSLFDTGSFRYKPILFTDEEQRMVDALIAGLTNAECFEKARNLAWNEKRIEARLICDHLLRIGPNHYDARILKGRTLAWDGQYEPAEVEFLDVMRRLPTYDDAYMALLDLYWWSGQAEKSFDVVEKAKALGIDNPELEFKLARAYKTLDKTEEALLVVENLVNKYPDTPAYREFKESLQSIN